MRDALLADLSELPYEIITTIDARVKNDATGHEHSSAGLQANIHAACRAIERDDDVWTIWKDLIAQVDAVLVIAPETDGVLLKFAQLTLSLGKIWLGCGKDAIEICGNKLKTYEFLRKNNVPVPTFTWQSFCAYEQEYPNTLFAKGNKYVAKPIDGAGCEDTFLFGGFDDLRHFMAPTQIKNRQKSHIIQYFIKGQPASLVMLCKNGQAHLLCCNRQLIQQQNKQLLFKGVEINGYAAHWQVFDNIAKHLAIWLPSLNGLVGVDIVFDETLACIIEINPRLTTSYAGLREAIGANPAELIINTMTDPDFKWPALQQNIVNIHV